MSESVRPGELVFRAESGGRLFGALIVQGGYATALTATACVRGRLTVVAMSWLAGQNPWPADEVRYSLVTGPARDE